VSQGLVYILSGVAVFGVCLYGLMVHAHLIRKILAINMMSSGVFLLLAGVARRGPEVDPVPHAMVLTGIVVTVGTTAFALALVRRVQAEADRAYLPEENVEEELDGRDSG
jgi:multicomponent Na+:H+ antiporter subunit C